MIKYTLRIATSDNAILAFIDDFSTLNYVLRGDGQISACELTVPIIYKTIFAPSNIDYRITIWRSINNQVEKLDGSTEFLTRKWLFTDTTITITAESIQSLLRRRINAYAANNTTYTKFVTKYAGNIMKDLVRFNLTSSYSTALRDGNDDYVVVPNLVVAGNMNDGIQMSISCSRDNVYETITKISQSSTTAGVWLIGQITSNGNTWTFETFPYFYGSNRTGQIMLSIANRNIENIELTYDRIAEQTAVITGGAGTDKARIIGSAFSAQITASVYNRTELFYSQPQAKSLAVANNWSDAVLRQSRAAFGFQADILQTPNFVRGIDYDVGDILSLSFLDTIYNVRLDVVSVSISNGSVKERAELRLL
jgi:hypothetical protein